MSEAVDGMDHNPTQAQKDSGNYRKGRLTWKGLPLTIETAKGQARTGTDKDGNKWSTTMTAHYGYIRGTKSEADGDHIDIFFSEAHPDSEIVFVVNQNKADGTFDEHKAVLGEVNAEDAEKLYRSDYSADWKGFDSIRTLTLEQFKEWLADGDSAKKAAFRLPASLRLGGSRAQGPGMSQAPTVRAPRIRPVAGTAVPQASPARLRLPRVPVTPQPPMTALPAITGAPTVPTGYRGSLGRRLASATGFAGVASLPHLMPATPPVSTPPAPPVATPPVTPAVDEEDPRYLGTEKRSVAKDATSTALPYRDRAEMYAMRDGKVFGGLYDHGGFGGGIDPGEDAATAAAREFAEETGWQVNNPRPLPFEPHTLDWKPPFDDPKLAERAKQFRRLLRAARPSGSVAAIMPRPGISPTLRIPHLRPPATPSLPVPRGAPYRDVNSSTLASRFTAIVNRSVR